MTLRVLALLPCLASIAMAQPPDRLKWRADIDFLEAQLPLKHGNLFHAVARQTLSAAFARLRTDLPSLDEDHVRARITAIVGMIEDGHNEVLCPCGGAPTTTDVPTNYPLRLWRDDGAIYIERAPAELARLAGGRIVAIDGHSAEDAWRAVAPLMMHDAGNLGHARANADAYLTCARLLHGVGIAARADRARFTIERSDGEHEEVELQPWKLPWIDVIRRRTPADWADARPGAVATPLWMRHPDRVFWMDQLREQRLLYVQINAVADAPDETMALFAKRLARTIAGSDVERLVLDLRRNGGGNNQLLRPLLVELIRAKTNRRGRFFVLIGPATFSAAQNLSNRLEAYTDAIFVGEPTGENINFYGDTQKVVLPNSKMTIGLAHLYWQDSDPRDTRKALMPEIAADMTFDDYRNGRDPALAYVLTGQTPPTLAETLLATVPHGSTAVRAAYDRYMRDSLHRYLVDPESSLNDLGYQLLGARRLDEAIAILAVNAETHPRSFNAWDSLGEVYAAGGRAREAVDAYERSLALNPRSETGLRALGRLRGTSPPPK